MSPNWLSAIGRAQPAITQAMQDIQERPKQEARWGFEQEKMGMEREQFKQQKAVNEITLNKMKFEEKQRQEKEAYLNKPWNAKMDLMLADLPEDYQEKALNMMRQTGLIDENNVGKMKSREMVTEMFTSKPEIFEWYAKGKETKLKGIAEKAMEDYQKLNDDPSVDPEKLSKARDKAVAAGEQLSVFMGGKSDILAKMKTAKEYGDLLNDIKKSDAWGKLSNEERGALEIGAIEAVKTGSTKGWDEAMKNVVKREKEATEKSANIHYETDTKGITTKVVSDPITGQTIRRENMGKIGKEKETKEPEKLSMTDIKSAYSMDIGNIKNQMMIDMTPDEQANLAGQPDVNILALLLSGRIGKSMGPEKKELYKRKLQEVEKYYGDLTNQVLGRKGAKVPPRTAEPEPEKTSPNIQKLHDQATEAIKLQPKRAEEIKKQYKEMTGREYK